MKNLLNNAPLPTKKSSATLVLKTRISKIRVFNTILSHSILAIAIATLSACGTQNKSSAQQSADRVEVTPEAASHKGKKLTVYSYDSFTANWGPAPKLKEKFEATCLCTIEFVPFEDGVTMFNRLRLEGSNTKADVVVGLDNSLINEAENSNLFAVTDINISQLKLPINWKNQTFIPYDYGQYAFIYNKNKLKNPPTSLKSLIENQNISVIYQDPRTSTVGRGLLVWINKVYGNQSESAWQKLAQHTVTIGKGWSETYEAFKKGESDVVLSYSTSPLYHQIFEDSDQYQAAMFEEGHIAQIELAAQLKSSDTPALASDFISFLITPESQKTIATSNIMLPVIDTKINTHFDNFKPFKTLVLPIADSLTTKEQISVWQTAVSQ